MQLELDLPVEPIIRDPSRRIGSARTIAGIYMFFGVMSLFYHIWSLVFTLKDPERIIDTGQTEAVVYIGISIMIIVSLILLPVSWKLFNRVGEIRSNPRVAIRACRSWRRWLGSFLTFFIISLMILVLSSGKQVHQGSVQNYMLGLLIIVSFSIYGIYYVGKLLNELKAFCENPDLSNTNNTDATTVLNPNCESQHPNIIFNTSAS